MNKLFIVDIEPLDNRYTAQWRLAIPNLAVDILGNEHKVIQISGYSEGYENPKEGAFFDFAATCEYKASQAEQIARLFQSGKVSAGDVFFFTDAWNQTIHTVKYISELNQIPVKIAGIWHAGYYDPTDILGFTIKNHEWVSALERSLYAALDMSFFGTQQHADKFFDRYDVDKSKHRVCGYPLDYLAHLKNNTAKEDIVVFPHRLNEDKAPYIFDQIAEAVQRDDIVFVKTQEMNLSKAKYYELLQKSKVVFSANKHENLGIGTFEAMMAGCIPVVPKKLSYAEMYGEDFTYEIFENEEEYIYNPKKNGPFIALMAKIITNRVDYYHMFEQQRSATADSIMSKYFTGTEMMQHIKSLFTENQDV